VSVHTAPKRIVILGSTGSIGKSALDVVRHYPGHFEVVALAAGANAELLAAQIREFRPAHAALHDEAAAQRLTGQGLPVAVAGGAQAVEDLAALEADVVLCAMVGAAGLAPVLRAIAAGNHVALANKEPMVMAGRLIMERAAQQGVKVLPVDSEHNAIFQCLQGHDPHDVRCVHLTASGGPFYQRDRASLAGVTPAMACKHPTWDMGPKISVDSATLMNKGLEIIEAMWMFGLHADQIEVVIHPQSIVHSFVEFNDGHMLAHLGVTDMKFPILFALTYPERVGAAMDRLDLTRMGSLTFGVPDFDAFPCLRFARAAAVAGGTAPAILNAANEVAVDAFCQGSLPFLGISDVVGEVFEQCPHTEAYQLEPVMEADARARAIAREHIPAHR
jgi:1-deoxy-D-xylulose-5-phosphate reductoisomerase